MQEDFDNQYSTWSFLFFSVKTEITLFLCSLILYTNLYKFSPTHYDLYGAFCSALILPRIIKLAWNFTTPFFYTNEGFVPWKNSFMIMSILAIVMQVMSMIIDIHYF